MADLRHWAEIRRKFAANSLLNIAAHSTTGLKAAQPPLLSIIERADNGSIDYGFPPLPTAPTYRMENRKATLDDAALATELALFAGESQRRLVSSLKRTQSRFFLRDIIAGRWDSALLLRHLDLEDDHVAPAKRHF